MLVDSLAKGTSLTGMYMEVRKSMTNTLTVSSRMSISGRVRLTQTNTGPALSSTVYIVLTKATSNGSAEIP